MACIHGKSKGLTLAISMSFPRGPQEGMSPVALRPAGLGAAAQGWFVHPSPRGGTDAPRIHAWRGVSGTEGRGYSKSLVRERRMLRSLYLPDFGVGGGGTGGGTGTPSTACDAKGWGLGEG